MFTQKNTVLYCLMKITEKCFDLLRQTQVTTKVLQNTA